MIWMHVLFAGRKSLYVILDGYLRLKIDLLVNCQHLEI